MERKISKKKRTISIDKNLNDLMDEIISNKSAYIEYLIYQDLQKNSNDDRIKKINI